MHAKSLQSCLTLQPYGLWPARLLPPQDSPGKNTGVGCHALSPGDLPNPGIEPVSLKSPALQAGSLPLAPPGKLTFTGPQDFPGGSDGKVSVYNAGDPGSSPGLGRSPGEGNGNPFQYYSLENPMDRGAW